VEIESNVPVDESAGGVVVAGALESDRLSTYRTRHRFERYAEFSTVEQFRALCEQASREGRRLLVLGNGSNVLFRRGRIRTLVARNKLGRVFEDLGEGRVRASSSLMISVILKHCRDQRLDSFYYLASVPATVGGAIAMNAGRGRSFGQSIFDFVERVTWFEDGEIRTASAGEIPHEYRWTPFAGLTGKLVLEAVFRFPPSAETEDKIGERVRFSKETQDHSLPNCGSVFKESKGGLMLRLRGLRLLGASYSTKTANWLLNRSPSPRGLVLLIRVAQVLHRLIGRRAVVELIEVD
jgi:UDP-N-acetylmuramate dehydrogenase